MFGGAANSIPSGEGLGCGADQSFPGSGLRRFEPWKWRLRRWRSTEALGLGRPPDFEPSKSAKEHSRRGLSLADRPGRSRKQRGVQRFRGLGRIRNTSGRVWSKSVNSTSDQRSPMLLHNAAIQRLVSWDLSICCYGKSGVWWDSGNGESDSGNGYGFSCSEIGMEGALWGNGDEGSDSGNGCWFGCLVKE